jgi:hypothetical protein
MKVCRCRICGAIKNSRGELFNAEMRSPLAKMRVILHSAIAHSKASADESNIEIIDV